MARREHFPSRLLLLFTIFLSACSSKQDSRPVFNASAVQVRWQNGLAMENNQPFTGIIFTLADNQKDTTELVGFLNGREHGEWKRFYEGGRLAEKRYFANGLKTGDYRAWWPNGTQKLVYHFEQGEYDGVCREWSDKGVLIKEMTYKNGYEDGSQKLFYDNGKVRANYVLIAGRRFGLLGTKNCVNATDSVFKN